MATKPSGEMAVAIAHPGPDGSGVLDQVKVMTVTGGERGIDAVFRGLRARGFEVYDHRSERRPGERERVDVRQCAIAGALRLAVEQ
jgi:hypothetical protein